MTTKKEERIRAHTQNCPLQNWFIIEIDGKTIKLFHLPIWNRSLVVPGKSIKHTMLNVLDTFWCCMVFGGMWYGCMVMVKIKYVNRNKMKNSNSKMGRKMFHLNERQSQSHIKWQLENVSIYLWVYLCFDFPGLGQIQNTSKWVTQNLLFVYTMFLCFVRLLSLSLSHSFSGCCCCCCAKIKYHSVD